jgi:hypothetical protein
LVLILVTASEMPRSTDVFVKAGFVIHPAADEFEDAARRVDRPGVARLVAG